MVKYYYRSLQQVYSIIITKILGIKLNLAFQIFFKTINNSVDPNKLVFTLLFFDIYSKIIKQDTLSPLIT